jgi:hypothetical protein
MIQFDGPQQRPELNQQEHGPEDEGDSRAGAIGEDLAVAVDDHEDNEEDNSSIEDEEEAIPQMLRIDDPRRMKLTKQEHRWAYDIKNTIQSMAELDNLSDFMYAQLAIITKGNLEDAIRRVTGLQHYRQEYNILDTLQDGCQQMKMLFEFFPEQFLDFSFSLSGGTYVLIHDVTKMDTAVLNTAEKVQKFMAAAYYLHTTMCPDMASIRSGCIAIMEW